MSSSSSLEDLFKQRDAKAEAAADAYNKANIADPSDPHLPALREARDTAFAARDAAKEVYLASRPAPVPAGMFATISHRIFTRLFCEFWDVYTDLYWFSKVGNISKTSHRRYKGDASKVDARLFLQSIADGLDEEFSIATAYSNPTFGDVKKMYYSNPNVKAKFSQKEWKFLFNLHQFTNQSLHGDLPFDVDGKCTVVMPHDFSNVPLLRSIAQKSHVIQNDSELIVLDAIDFSSGSDTNGH